jgi:[ribosomal protein S5]-alanine N-acetyltransferase
VTRPRLRWERPWQEHLPLYRALFAEPAVARALWPAGPASGTLGDRGEKVLAADIRHWQERAFGPWAFFSAPTGLFVGRGGLMTTTVAGRRCVEVAYAVRPEEWGQGYATEMAVIAVAHARTLGLAEVVGLSAEDNRASRRVLEKCGMRYERTVQRAGIAHWVGGVRPIV